MRNSCARLTLALCSTAVLLGGCAVAGAGDSIATTGGSGPRDSIATTGAGGASERIPFTLSKPDGSGPFPGVVIMHDCSGLGPRSSGAPDRWAKELVRQGYVVVVPDSFTTRGYAEGVCTHASPNRTPVAPPHRIRDAYAALAHLRTLPYVDGRRVGIMGGSHGGSTVLAAMEGDAGRAGGFLAGVALYPRCGTWASGSTLSGTYRSAAPLLILIGDKDDWTPAESCQKLADAARAAGQPVAIKIYPGAHHSFDSDRPVRYVAARVNPSSPTGRGATTGGDPHAWADSIREVLAFFGRYLK